MARMDIRKARALAEQMIMSGQNDGLTREDLVQQIIAKAEGAGAPGTAIGAALVPVTLTPAATAPMQPGVPLRAPKPTTEMVPQPQPQELPVAPQRAARPSRYQPELDRIMANIAVAEQAMAGKQPNVTDQIRLGGLKQQAERLGALVRAEQSPEAEIPEEMRAALEGRQARLARREELLGEQQARAPFAALLAAGAAGTQGRRGETDVEAITRILQAGFGGYDQSRRGFEEGAENIAEARDQAMIDRYNMQMQAREAAVQRARDIVGMGREARDEAIKEVRLPTQLRGEEAETELAEFKVRDAPVEAASVRKLRADQGTYYGNRPTTGSDPDKPMTENQRQTKIQQLMLKRNDYAVKLAQAKMFGGAGSAELAAAIKAIDERLLALKTGGGAPATAGTSAPSFVYSPGRGLQPVR